MSLSTSDILSSLALFVAIITGIANYIYTKKIFEASNHPLIKFSLKTVSQFWNTRFDIEVSNLSINTPITDVNISAYLIDPTRKWKFWKKRLVLFDSLQYNKVIQPSDSSLLKMGSSFEPFLISKFKTIQEITTKGNDGKIIKHYRVSKNKPLNFLLIIEYRPAISASKIMKVSERYAIFPEYSENEIEKEKLLFWNIKNI